MNLTPQTPPHPSGDKRFKLLDLAIKRHQFRQDALIEMHSAQELFGFLDNDVLVYVGRSLRVPLSRVHGVATFYNFFSMKPPGKHTCVVSMGTACYVKGAGRILDALEKEHGIEAGETTEDGNVSLVTARCLGACGLAPAVVFDGEVAGIIATGQNDLAMNATVLQIARHYVKGQKLQEGMLNRVEAGIRAFDPCLSCSTHAYGEIPLQVELRGHDGALFDSVSRS